MGDAGPIQESILLRKGHYVGRKFIGGSMIAVWWDSSDVVEIMDQDGQVVRKLQIEPGTLQQRAA